MRSFVTGDGCQPVDNDLRYDNVILSLDNRFDICCTGMVSSSSSPDQMQHALWNTPGWCEDILVCQVELVVLFAFFHVQCKTSPRCEKPKTNKKCLMELFKIVAIFQPAWRDTKRSVT